MSKPILTLDFDGVIHSYSSGWKGASVIPDAPVPGALQFIVESLEYFQINILSSRSHQWGGKRAMRKWLRFHLEQLAPDWDRTPKWLQDRIVKTSFCDPWEHEVEYAVSRIIAEIKWPWFKPASLLTIDDRAICFTGEFPTIEQIKTFKPWNKR